MFKKIVLYPFTFLESLLDRITAVLGALLFSQLPMFFAQYQQRLGGHVDELARIIAQYHRAASESGKSLDAFIQLHTESNIPEFVKTGKIMLDNVDRLTGIKAALDALSASPSWKKIFIFIKTLQPDIASATLKNFTPGIPTTLEGLVYAGCGILFGMLVYLGVKKCAGLIFRKIGKRGPGAYRDNSYSGT